MPRILIVLLSVVFAAAGCSAGPEAPLASSGDVACADPFCAGYPEGWSVEIGGEYLAFMHPDSPEQARATVAFVHTEGVVTAAGGTWPATTETVVRSFWTLLEDQGLASFERMERVGEGRITAIGSYEGGRLWTLFIPVDSQRVVGIEVRGPNKSWEPHAELFFDQVVVTP